MCQSDNSPTVQKGNEIKFAKLGKHAIEGGHRVFEKTTHVTHDPNAHNTPPVEAGNQDYVMDLRDEGMLDGPQPIE